MILDPNPFDALIDDQRHISCDRFTWKKLNTLHSKADLIDSMIECIDRNDLPFPGNATPLTIEEMRTAFFKLRRLRTNIPWIPGKLVQTSNVLEKYTDYKYGYSQYGLGLIDSVDPTLSAASNYFQESARMKCASWGFPSPVERWKSAKHLRTELKALWRMGNDHLDIRSFGNASRLASYVATQFKPQVATAMYELFSAKRVLDTSCGWGDRLCGFYASNATHYTGFDPNPETFANYKIQCIAYEKLLGCDSPQVIEDTDRTFILSGAKTVNLYRMPAEEGMKMLTSESYDIMFSSPPYFCVEKYGIGQPGEEEQSWRRYTTYEEWREGFFFPVLRESIRVLRPFGILAVNIIDPTIKTKRNRVCDEMIDYIDATCTAKFLGQIGMRMKQRPAAKGSKEKLDAHMSKTFIEPIWTFVKSKIEDDKLNAAMYVGLHQQLLNPQNATLSFQ